MTAARWSPETVDETIEKSQQFILFRALNVDLLLPSGNFTIFHIAIENDPVEIVDLPIENGDVP